MNPFEQKPSKLEDGLFPWSRLYPQPYDKQSIDPYTKIRIILMNGIEVEASLFQYQFYRNCQNTDLRRELALIRRIEQQQQKHINWLKPIEETQLETTIGYEHVAVDLTAWLAQNEPNAYVKEALDFALLEDFDHLYRYANLLDLDAQIPAEKLVKSYVDITPGRPTIAEYRFPYDSVKTPIDAKTADIRTKLNTLIITAAEQQTMNFYMNVGNSYHNDVGRQLYQEIAMIEEDHVSHYGSLLDPNCTWLEQWLLHEYMECYLYYSFYQDEVDLSVKSIWEQHLQQEITHLHKVSDLLRQWEGRDWQSVIPDGTFPKLLQFHDTRDYVREVLAKQGALTANGPLYASVSTLPPEHPFFLYQGIVNQDSSSVPSHQVISLHQQRYNIDYRAESSPNPVQALSDRTKDNTSFARQHPQKQETSI